MLAATTDRLRAEAGSTAALLAAQSDKDAMTGVVLELGNSLGVALDTSQATQIGLAALAIRQREVAVAEVAHARVARLTAARAAGGGWVVLEESGDPAGSPFAPYRRLEAESESGRALLVRGRAGRALRVDGAPGRPGAHRPAYRTLSDDPPDATGAGDPPAPLLPDAAEREARGRAACARPDF